MYVGYNTNGLAHHRWDDAIALVAEAGYRGIALTIDHHCLDPRSGLYRQEMARARSLLERYQLRCVIETGARFLLDPRRKHQPTLISETEPERRQRRAFLEAAIELAAELQADAVSFWSGAAIAPAVRAGEAVAVEECWSRLIAECERLTDVARSRQVRLAFEPEPGMFVERMSQYARLHSAIQDPLFGLTLDVGHVHCLQDGSIADQIRSWKDSLFNVHLEDMCVGVHEHLPFGRGTMTFEPIFASLRACEYQGGVFVELSRQSVDGLQMLDESRRFLAQFVPG